MAALTCRFDGNGNYLEPQRDTKGWTSFCIRVILNTTTRLTFHFHNDLRIVIRGSAGLSGGVAARAGGTKAGDELDLLQWLGQVALDPHAQHALANVVIRIGSDENRWNCTPGVDQMRV